MEPKLITEHQLLPTIGKPAIATAGKSLAVMT
jgi:hypothetical protein